VSGLAREEAGTAKTEVFFRAPASLETVPPVAVAHQRCAVRWRPLLQAGCTL